MSDLEPTPDDLVVSAVLDGVATADEIERVAADPRLTARLARFRSVADAVGAPVPLVDTAVREAHLTRALAEGVPYGVAPPSPSPSPSRPAAPPIDLGAARTRRRHRPRHVAVLSAAAVVVLLVVAGTFLAKAGDPGGRGGDDEVAATDRATFESSGDPGAETAVRVDPQPGSVTPSPDAPVAGPASTVAGAPAANSADSAGAAESALDAPLPDLGRFTEPADLVTRVRRELASGTRDLTSDEPCRDDFDVPVILLGRASLDGDEGLVYVETAQTAGRRVWLVAADQDSDTPGVGCRQITPVQSL